MAFNSQNRSRLTSTGEETEDEDVQDDCQFDMEPNWYDLDDHYRNLAQREHLQEFPGRIPTQRQKKKETDTRSKAKVDTLSKY